MKHNKTLAALAVAGGLFAMSGAANAIAPAAAIFLAIGAGAAAGSAAEHASQPPAVAVVPAAPATVVMGAGPAPATVVQGHYEVINGVSTWVPATTVITTPAVTDYDNDGDGVPNSLDRFPNDPGRS